MRGGGQMSRCRRVTAVCMVSIALLLLGAGCGQKQAEIKPGHAVQTNSEAYPVTISNYDYTENIVDYTYHQAPQRVVVTHPGATELLLELGLDERILATVAPYGSPVERIAGKYAKLNITKAQYMPSAEEMLEMQPDLIIGWVQHFSPNEMGEVKTWQGRGVGTYILPSTLLKTKPTLENSVYRSIADIGSIFGIKQAADSYIRNLKLRVEKIQETVRDLPEKKKVIVLQDHSNGTFSVYDSQYLISHMIELAGGKNLCEERTSFVSAEKVLSFDPDVIIFVSFNDQRPTEDLDDQAAVGHLQSVVQLRSMRAIQQGNIINLPFFTVNNGGIRTVDAIEKIAAGLYPDKF